MNHDNRKIFADFSRRELVGYCTHEQSLKAFCFWQEFHAVLFSVSSGFYPEGTYCFECGIFPREAVCPAKAIMLVLIQLHLRDRLSSFPKPRHQRSPVRLSDLRTNSQNRQQRLYHLGPLNLSTYFNKQASLCNATIVTKCLVTFANSIGIEVRVESINCFPKICKH